MRTMINPYKKLDKNPSGNSILIKKAKVPKKLPYAC